MTLWAIAHQASLSMGFPRQKYWSGLPFSSPGDLPDPGIEPELPALADGFFTLEPLEKLREVSVQWVHEKILKNGAANVAV